MQNDVRFHPFFFRPKKLLEERMKIENKFKDAEKEIALLRSQIELPKLLNLIRATPFEEIAEWSKSLRKMDVLLLLYEYPYPEESDETKRKINHILTTRYVGIVGRTVWGLFQQDIVDLFLQDLIRSSYSIEKDTFLGLDEEMLLVFGVAMGNQEGIIEGLIPYLLTMNEKSNLVLKKWKVKENSVLEETLTRKMLIEGLSEDFIIHRDGMDYVIQQLDHYPLNDYKKLLQVYLEAREYTKFHPAIMRQAIQRLLDPREYEENWRFLSKEAFSRVLRWLFSHELKKFFEKDTNSIRFNYWKRFIDYMVNVTLLKDPFVAFIDFGPFVVVEFGNMGAAYFYHKEGFEEFILPLTKNRFGLTRSTQRKEEMLKDKDLVKQGIKLFIDKLDHRGYWQRNFDLKMQQYLNL